MSFPLQTNMRLLTPARPGPSPEACHAFTWPVAPLAHESREEVVHVTCSKGPAWSQWPSVTGPHALGALGEWLAGTGRGRGYSRSWRLDCFLGSVETRTSVWHLESDDEGASDHNSPLFTKPSRLLPPEGVSQADLIPGILPPSPLPSPHTPLPRLLPTLVRLIQSFEQFIHHGG